MRLALRHRPGPWVWPIRIVFGLFFAHVALTHRELDDKGAKGLQRFAASGWPFVTKLPPMRFKQAMVAGECAVAASLLVPAVPAVVGGAALTGFGTGLLGVYARTPMLRRGERNVRPSDLGLSIAKDSWMVAAGLAMVVDALVPARRSHRSAARSLAPSVSR